MRHDRIYKSLPLEDYIEQCSFIFAHGGVYLGGVISDFNYIRTLPRMAEMSDAELKTEFMQNVIKALESCQEVNIQVNNYGKYYDVWYDWCDTPEDSCISEESKEQHSGDIFVIGKITSDEKEKMSLEDFLVWSLSGAKQAYECNLPENSLAWDSLSDEDKMGLVAHEINSNSHGLSIALDDGIFGEVNDKRKQNLIQCMEIAGRYFVENQSSQNNLVFTMGAEITMRFANWNEVEVWLDEFIFDDLFDDPEVSRKIEKILHSDN